MKRTLLILILTAIYTERSLAPDCGFVSLLSCDPVRTVANLQDWVEAVIWVESGSDLDLAQKPSENASGRFQQRPVFVRDVNRIVGYEKYTLDDRRNPVKATEMFWVYQNYYNPTHDPAKMCRIQCGGPDGYLQDCTLTYLTLVKNRLNDLGLTC